MPPSNDPSFWRFRRRPLGDIAQCVLELMEDETQWRAGLLALHHLNAAVTVRNTGFYLSVAAGDASLRLEGRDRRALEKAFRRLKRRLAERGQAALADRLREALALRRTGEQRLVPAPDESIESVERRVRRLREAISMRT